MEQLIIFAVLLLVGYGVGTMAESRHYRSIKEREQQFLGLPLLTLKRVPGGNPPVEKSGLVYGSVVISVDYFKRFLAALRNLFGGRIAAYETLLDRARREAILRMEEMAPGADVILKATKVDGVYSKDPAKYKTAKKFKNLIPILHNFGA